MNIDRLSSSGGDPVVNRPQPSGEPVRREGPSARAARRRDEITVSQEARVRQAAARAVDETPDVRAERIAEILRRIEDGTYSVADQDLARAMLQHLDDEP